MSNKSNLTVVTMGIDIGKNAFHVVGLDRRGAIVLRQRWSRRQVEVRLANMRHEDGRATRFAGASTAATRADAVGQPVTRSGMKKAILTCSAAFGSDFE
jgi:hypothetical protein